jgi:hypothetical protein
MFTPDGKSNTKVRIDHDPETVHSLVTGVGASQAVYPLYLGRVY